MGEQRNSELGDFLRARRAELTPEQTGVATYGSARRVPGLRREEVAQLAGLSVNYYTRIEQGEGHQMSGQVMEAIADALRLDSGQRMHLLRLAWPPPVLHPDNGPEIVRDSVLALVASNTEQAVLVLGRHTDLLGGNALGFALYGLEPDARPNMTKWMFLEPSVRDLVVDWELHAEAAASYLRMATSERPDDPKLAELVGELSINSPEFARIWATHPVAECSHSIREFDHPRVGKMTLNEEALRLPDDPGQRMTFAGAEPGSESERRLHLLASLIA
ncbi:MAG TPA: helix-turn-helix transcriptional regulator [Pseudonocardiaceae bacterium]|nr:helix-turn-helix transcriptional regulator [Pseudonocardiaceae bacterium]